MSSQFQVRYLLSRGGAMVIGILRTMCHVITDVTANHRPSSRKVRVLPVRQFAVRSSLITNTQARNISPCSQSRNVNISISAIWFVGELVCRRVVQLPKITPTSTFHFTHRRSPFELHSVQQENTL